MLLAGDLAAQVRELAQEYQTTPAALIRELVVDGLRTSCATLLAQAGVPVPTIQRQLRHRDVRTTLRYVEVGLADLRDASERTWGGQIRHTDQADTA